MGEASDIAIVAVINDIFKYDVSLMIAKIDAVYHVTLTWLGKIPDGSTALGIAKGNSPELYKALTSAYTDMTKSGEEK